MDAQFSEADKQALEIHYRELARLADHSENLTSTAFDDIKLLGGVGALLSWKPLLGQISGSGAQAQQVYLLLGYLLIVLALGIIGYAALMKQSVVLFYLREIQRYEAEIRRRLGQENADTFRVAAMWHGWSEKTQQPLGRLFYGHFYLVIVLFPSCVLLFSGGPAPNSASWLLAGICFVVSVAVCLTHYRATTKIVYTPANVEPLRDGAGHGSHRAGQKSGEGR